MNMNKISQQLDRRMEAIDRRRAEKSDRQPIEDIGRIMYSTQLYYEDAELRAKVFDVRDYLRGEFKGVFFNKRGPWVLFKVEEILSGDYGANIGEGSIILASWDRTYKVYRKFIYSEDPKPGDKSLVAIQAFIPVSEAELLG